jgi:hypothetical protein
MRERSPKEDALVGGLDDWQYESWIYGSTRLAGLRDYASRRTLALGLIAELLVEDLMVAGDVDEQGHHPWPCSPGEAVERIARRWLTEWADELPTPGAIVWLANTPRGNEIAQAVVRREQLSEVPDLRQEER